MQKPLLHESTLRQHAELKLSGKEQALQRADAKLPLAEVQKVLHELQVHQIELEMQNEELRHLHDALEAARARYFDLYDLAPVAYCTVGKNGLILESNFRVAELLGARTGRLNKQALSHFVARTDQDIYYLFQNRFKSPGQSHSCELRMVNSEAKTIWVRLAATSHAGDAGEQVLRVVMTDISEPVRAQVALQDAHQHLRSLSLRQQEEFDQLRGELARDLHDQLGQTLSTLKLEIDMIAARAPDAAKRMYHLVKEGVSTVRDVSRALRPVALELGLGRALRAMAAELSRRTDVDIQVSVAPGLPALAEATEGALYRIAQEALTNAANHAGASVIAIALNYTQDRLTLQVMDDGRGIPATDPGSRMGLGMIGMRERAKLLGAALSLETAPGQGTRITVVLTAAQLRSKP